MITASNAAAVKKKADDDVKAAKKDVSTAKKGMQTAKTALGEWDKKYGKYLTEDGILEYARQCIRPGHDKYKTQVCLILFIDTLVQSTIHSLF